MPTKALARQLGVDKTTVLNAKGRLKGGEKPIVENRSALGQFLPGPWRTPGMERVEAAILANPGMSSLALAKQLDVGKTTVLNAMRRLNVTPPRIAGAARVEAAVLVNPGMSSGTLAKQLGVSKSMVKRIRQRLKSKPGEEPQPQA
jgi:hypothetical protein